MAAEHDNFLGWPGRKNLAYAYLVLGPPLCLWFALVYGGADWLTGLHEYRVPLYFAFELSIPFVPAMVLFYNSLHLAYCVTPFILRTRAEMNAMAVVWVLITFCAGLVFLVIPFEVGFPGPSVSALGPWRTMYEWADRVNLTFNSCPSLHVAWGIVCVDLFAGKAHITGKTMLWIWGAGMMLSTLLLHQHHIADVAGGFLLAMVGSRILYPVLREKFQRDSLYPSERRCDGIVGESLDSDCPARKTL